MGSELLGSEYDRATWFHYRGHAGGGSRGGISALRVGAIDLDGGGDYHGAGGDAGFRILGGLPGT